MLDVVHPVILRRCDEDEEKREEVSSKNIA
jgi:hypothetical protein